jgi:hypothetical protein
MVFFSKFCKVGLIFAKSTKLKVPYRNRSFDRAYRGLGAGRWAGEQINGDEPDGRGRTPPSCSLRRVSIIKPDVSGLPKPSINRR